MPRPSACRHPSAPDPADHTPADPGTPATSAAVCTRLLVAALRPMADRLEAATRPHQDEIDPMLTLAGVGEEWL